jgi:hypothetical protein
MKERNKQKKKPQRNHWGEIKTNTNKQDKTNKIKQTNKQQQKFQVQ